jgi:hypothetical protein
VLRSAVDINALAMDSSSMAWSIIPGRWPRRDSYSHIAFTVELVERPVCNKYSKTVHTKDGKDNSRIKLLSLSLGKSSPPIANSHI